MNAGEGFEVWRIILDATNENIKRIRGTLVLVIALTCMGFVHLYLWYASWDLARISARHAVIERLADLHRKGGTFTGSVEKDRKVEEEMIAEMKAIEKARTSLQFKPPLLGLTVGADDFGVVIQMIGVAALLWLTFNQKRLNFCLETMGAQRGWGPPESLLELHFGLVGSHARGIMKPLGRLLPLALPFTSLLFLSSDLYDLARIKDDPLKSFCFADTEYRLRVFVRLGSGAFLGLCVLVLGVVSYIEWKATEDSLTKFSEEEPVEADGVRELP
jgi:hypothetical protein